MGELLEGIGQLEAAPPGACLRQLALLQKSSRKAGSGEQGFLLQKSVAPFRRSDRIAFAAEANGVSQQKVEGQLPAERPGQLKRKAPAADGSGDGERRIGTARRDGVIILGPVTPDRGESARRSRGIQGMNAALGLPDEPEAVAPSPFMCGYTTAMVAAMATIASTALPPAARMVWPVWAARV